jgi:hypothetical protein
VQRAHGLLGFYARKWRHQEEAMAQNTQSGTQQGIPQRTDDKSYAEGIDKDENALETDVEQGVGNDSGTIPGRKVDHSNPLDIPPRGMKRKY